MPSVASALGPPPPNPNKVSAALGPDPSLHDVDAEAGAKAADSGFTNALWQGQTYGYGDEIDGFIARALRGDAYGNALEEQERKNLEDYRSKHPILSGTAGLIGGLASPGVGPAGKAVSGIGSGVGRLAGNVALGGAMGAAQGSGEATEGHRLSSAGVGGIAGGLTGGLLHYAGDWIGAGATRAKEWLESEGGGATSRAIKDTYNRASDLVHDTLNLKRIPTAVRNAAERLREAIKDDNVTPEKVDDLQKERASHGLPPATVAQAGDENVSSVLRYASSKLGEGRSAAVKERVRQRTSLAGTGVEHAESVRPAGVTESPAQRVDRIVKEQEGEAGTIYRKPYAKMIPADEKFMGIVSSDEGRKALDLARKTARERIDHPEAEAQTKQIDAIQNYTKQLDEYEHKLAEWKKSGGIDTSTLSSDAKALLDAAETPAARERVMRALKIEPTPEPVKPEPPQISAGAIDRIRIAMRNRADSLKNTEGEKKDTHALGVALKSREQALDKYLDGVPGLEEARAAYKEKQSQIDAANFEKSVLNEDTRDFATHVAGLSEEARNSLRVVAHQEIVDAFRKPGQSIAMMEKLATDAQAHKNLAVLMGPEEADKLSRASWLRLEDLRKANKIAPDTGSQTQLRKSDSESLAKIWFHISSPHGLLRSLIGARLSSGQLTLTKPEASALEKMGRGSPEELLELLKSHPNSPLSEIIKTTLAKEMGGYEGGQASEGDEDTRKKIELLGDGDNGRPIGEIGPDGKLTVNIYGDEPK